MIRTKITTAQEYVRFSLTDRIEHLLLLVSFTVLVITGIPQKYVPAPWAETMIWLMGGIEVVRIIHRAAALVMIIESVYHIIRVGHKIYVHRVKLSMFPTFQDIIDFLDAVRFNLGLARKHPHYDRFSFEEKLEYWAVVWGTVVMVITGFMLWNPISTTRFLPGSFIPAAKAAHGGEALLAFLAIVVWHLYNVHIKTFNKSIFTGKLTEEQMLDEHPKELERINAGKERPEPPRETIRRRERIFLPLAAMFTIGLTFLLYFFVTYEETAIATIPPDDTAVEVFVKATPTPEPAATDSERLADLQGEGGVVPHAVAGREDCLQCHGATGLYPYSPSHAELHLGNATCATCHEIPPDQETLPTVEAVE